MSTTTKKTTTAVPHASAARAPAATGGGGDDGGTKHKRPASSYVFLRIKRKRNEDPVETLVVHSEPELKKQFVQKSGDGAEKANGAEEDREGEEKKDAPSSSSAAASPADLLKSFTKLSTKEKRYNPVFFHLYCVGAAM